MRTFSHILAASLLATALWACKDSSGGDNNTNADAAVPKDSTAAACTPETLEDECPAKPCEVAVACLDGACQYEPFYCGVPGQVCPVEVCVSDTQEGVVVNQCQIQENAPCGDGGVCQDNQCVKLTQGIQLQGGLQVAPTSVVRNGVHVEGELGFSGPSRGPRRRGSVVLSGGFSP